jgi:hemerythrin
MSTISDFNNASNSEIDGEHQVQLGLLQALCDAAGAKGDSASVAEILDQLIAFSEAHFMSEELLMRLKSYDDYEDHVDEHIHMMDALNRISADHAAGDSALVSGKAEEVLGFIGKHIATRDRRFADFVRSGQ